MSRRFAIVLGICFLALGVIFFLPPTYVWAGILFCITGVACLIRVEGDKPGPGNPVAFVLVALLAVVLIAIVAYEGACWRNGRRVTAVTRLLYKGIQDYRQRTGQLPPRLDLLAEGKVVDAGWLRNVTNTYSVSYDPGSSPEKRMPRLSVSAPLAGCMIQGPGLECPPNL